MLLLIFTIVPITLFCCLKPNQSPLLAACRKYLNRLRMGSSTLLHRPDHGSLLQEDFSSMFKNVPHIKGMRTSSWNCGKNLPTLKKKIIPHNWGTIKFYAETRLWVPMPGRWCKAKPTNCFRRKKCSLMRCSGCRESSSSTWMCQTVMNKSQKSSAPPRQPSCRAIARV